MSSQEAKFVATPEMLHIDPDGKMFYYFSNVLDTPDQMRLQEWAHAVVAEDTEVNLSIMVDIPATLLDAINGGYCSPEPDGTYLAPSDRKPSFDAIKQQLEEALALLTKIRYESA